MAVLRRNPDKVTKQMMPEGRTFTPAIYTITMPGQLWEELLKLVERKISSIEWVKENKTDKIKKKEELEEKLLNLKAISGALHEAAPE